MFQNDLNDNLPTYPKIPNGGYNDVHATDSIHYHRSFQKCTRKAHTRKHTQYSQTHAHSQWI